MFDAMPLYLWWLTAGVLLAVMELIIPGTYLIWFGFAAVVNGLITLFVPDLSVMWQLIWLAVFSIVFAFIGWKITDGRFFTRSCRKNIET